MTDRGVPSALAKQQSGEQESDPSRTPNLDTTGPSSPTTPSSPTDPITQSSPNQALKNQTAEGTTESEDTNTKMSKMDTKSHTETKNNEKAKKDGDAKASAVDKNEKIQLTKGKPKPNFASTNEGNTKQNYGATGEKKLHEGASKLKEGSGCDSVYLKKELGLMEGVTIIMGIVIGAGIFVTPKGVISIVGSVGLSLMVWAGTGVLSIIGALCFAELGTMIPENGGMYTYLHESFGPVPAFLCIWVKVVISHGAGLAVVSLIFASYLVQAILDDCTSVSDTPVKLIAISLVCFHSYVNCINVRWAAQVQNVFTASKMVALIVIVVAGLSHLFHGHTQNYANPLQGSNWSIAGIATACYQSIFTYGGWENLCYVVEELKNPSRNLPLAIVISMSLVTVMYVLTNVAYLAVLTPSEILSSGAVAVTFAHRTLGVMAWIMPLFVLCSTFGSVNGGVFTHSRLVFAGARKCQLPEAFSLLHVDKCTPVLAICLNGLLTILMTASSDMLSLIQYATFAGTLTNFGCVCALFWFRYKEPEKNRPYKVHLCLAVVYTILLVFLLILPLIYDPINVGISIALIASGLPIYYLTIHRQDLVQKIEQPMNKLTYWIQLVFRSVQEEKLD